MYQRNKTTTHPKQGWNALLLSHLILGAFLCLPLRAKLENPTQRPAATASGLKYCSLLSVTETNSKAFTINSEITFCASEWSWHFLFKNIMLLLNLCTAVNLKNWKIQTSTPRTIFQPWVVWNLLAKWLQGHRFLHLLMIQISGQMLLSFLCRQEG